MNLANHRQYNAQTNMSGYAFGEVPARTLHSNRLPSRAVWGFSFCPTHILPTTNPYNKVNRAGYFHGGVYVA